MIGAIFNTAMLFLLLAATTNAALSPSGLVLHLSAEAIQTNSSGQVTNLLDLSTIGSNIRYNSGDGHTYGAVLNPDSLNSYNTLTMTNRGFRLTPELATNLNVSASGLTLFLVASVPHNSDSKYIFRKQAGSVNNPGYNLMMYTNGVKAWTSQDSSNRRAQFYDTTAGDFFVLTMVINMQDSTLSTHYNGETFTTAVSAGTLSSLSNTNYFDIGDGVDGMRFAELAVYNRVLTDAEREDTADQLNLKYGITDVETVTAVDDGVKQTAHFWQTAWASGGGYLSNASLENVIYADCYVGSGDFRVDARLAIDSLDSNCDAGFVMNEYNVFGFSGEQGRMYTKGRMWGRQLLSTVAANVITEGEEFDFVLERKGDRLSVSINDTLVYETDFKWRWAGELGFRCLRVKNFSVTGHMLSTEQYLYNSPTYGRDNGPITIEPVVLPEGSALVENNWHFGWPIATKAGNALVVVYHRAPHHDGSSRPVDLSASAAMVVRSTDGGASWSSPFDLETIIQESAINNPGGMRAIGTSSQGTVVLIGRKGAFRSTDNGVTWTHYPDAFPEVNEPDVVSYNLGPNIVKIGGKLTAFAHVGLADMKYADWLLCWQSGDDGVSWTYSKWPVPADHHPLEPAVFVMNETMYMLGRYHDYKKAFDTTNGWYSMVQLSMPTNGYSYPTKARISNIHASYALDALLPLVPPDKTILGTLASQDTADIAYNPDSRRIEAVVANRTGGGAGQEHDITKQTLNLWSLSPDEYRAGNVPWHFEATLLERETMDVTKAFDGMHAGGSVIDTQAGVQHIFVYLGYYHGPAGIYRVTRPLDRSVISNWWNSVKEEKTAAEMAGKRRYYSTLGTGISSSTIVPELVSSGLILRMDGTNASVGSGGRVTNWSSSICGTYNLKPPSGSLGPIRCDNALNGRPILQFEKSDSTRLALSAAQATAFNPGANDMTFVIVCNPYTYGAAEATDPTDPPDWQRILMKGNTAWSGQEGYSINAVFARAEYGRLITRAATGVGNSDQMYTQATANPADADFLVYTAILRAGEGLEGWLSDCLYNTGEGARPMGPQGEFAGSINPASDDLMVGEDFDGEIAEILVYNRALTEAELNKVRAYLRDKYDLPTLSPIIKVD